MSENRRFGNGIELLFPPNWPERAPYCQHGPMLLFQKISSYGNKNHQFYSCSASRDGNTCCAIVKGHEWGQWKKSHELNFKTKTKSKHLTKSLFEFQCKHSHEMHFCFMCDLLFNKGMKSCDYKKHTVTKVTKLDVYHPSINLLKPLSQNKTNAQYFLAPNCVDFLTITLQSIGSTHVLCMGMPRLHEVLQCSILNFTNCVCLGNRKSLTNTNAKSFLLDLDSRFSSFSVEGTFGWFNMFNHYFMDENSEKYFLKFIEDCVKNSGKMCIVTDPPFGGLVNAISNTLEWIFTITKRTAVKYDVQNIEDPVVMWLFPYFMENRIVQRMKDMHMVDYIFQYSNHKKFKQKMNLDQKPSPVRLFTNYRGVITLPSKEGYTYCNLCERFVTKANKHCEKCKTCPSKDGRTYQHCDACRRCVKPGKIHCIVCQRCQNINHDCELEKNLFLTRRKYQETKSNYADKIVCNVLNNTTGNRKKFKNKISPNYLLYLYKLPSHQKRHFRRQLYKTGILL